jgi:hypothetical protein
VNTPSRAACSRFTHGRARVPVAISRRSKSTNRPSARRTWCFCRSNPVAATPRIHSAWISRSCGRVVWSIGNHPVRTDLDKGGRSYGSHGSSPIRVRCPVNPSFRSASAALKPAREAPTITTLLTGTKFVLTDLPLVIIHLPGCRCACLSLVVHQPSQYLWPELGMRPLPSLPVYVACHQGRSHIRGIAPHENGTLLERQRYTVHSSDTGSNQLQSSYKAAK